MSEKRFVQLGDTHIKDMVTGEEWYAPCETSLLGLLNEQQAIIEEQNKEIKELKEKIQRIYVNVCSAMSEVIDDE